MNEQLLPNLHRIAVPLPGNPMRFTNCYVIKSDSRNLLIDTGWLSAESISAVTTALDNLRVDLGRTDFFLTHYHSDHSALVPDLITPHSRVYLGEDDADCLRSDSFWQGLFSYALQCGFPHDALNLISEMVHRYYRFEISRKLPFDLVSGGEILAVGRYAFTCIKTPGHTPGHMCLYEPHERVLLCGDHLFRDAVPIITIWSPSKNPLRDYLNSLDKLMPIDTEFVLPGHGGPFEDAPKRIGEIVTCHNERLAEILSIVKRDPVTPFSLVSQLKWHRISANGLDPFSLYQKWVAVGEGIAYLRYLEEMGLIYRDPSDEFRFCSFA